MEEEMYEDVQQEPEKQSFHRMPSERRRKLWSLAARAAIKCPDDADKETSLQQESLSTRDNDGLAITQDSGVSMDFNSEAAPFSSRCSSFLSASNNPASMDNDNNNNPFSKSELRQPFSGIVTSRNPISTKRRFDGCITRSADLYDPREKERAKMYDSKRKFTLPTTSQPDKFQLVDPRQKVNALPYGYGNGSFQQQGSADTSGIGSSLDWASIEAGQQPSRQKSVAHVQSFNEQSSTTASSFDELQAHIHRRPTHRQFCNRPEYPIHTHLTLIDEAHPPMYSSFNSHPDNPSSVKSGIRIHTVPESKERTPKHVQKVSVDVYSQKSQCESFDRVVCNSGKTQISLSDPVVTASAPGSPMQRMREQQILHLLRNPYSITRSLDHTDSSPGWPVHYFSSPKQTSPRQSAMHEPCEHLLNKERYVGNGHMTHRYNYHPLPPTLEGQPLMKSSSSSSTQQRTVHWAPIDYEVRHRVHLDHYARSLRRKLARNSFYRRSQTLDETLDGDIHPCEHRKAILYSVPPPTEYTEREALRDNIYRSQYRFNSGFPLIPYSTSLGPHSEYFDKEAVDPNELYFQTQHVRCDPRFAYDDKSKAWKYKEVPELQVNSARLETPRFGFYADDRIVIPEEGKLMTLTQVPFVFALVNLEIILLLNHPYVCTFMLIFFQVFLVIAIKIRHCYQ